MKTLSRPILLGCLLLGTFGLSNAYARECSLDYGIATMVNSDCTSLTFNQSFQGREGKSAILSCGLRSKERNFSIRGEVMMTPETMQKRSRILSRGPRRAVAQFTVHENGPVNFRMDPAVVKGEGDVACIVEQQGGVPVSRVRR